MPLYDYHCKACDKEFELLVRSGTVPVCPSCGSDNLEKQVSVIAPQGQTAGILAKGRAQAERAGHFSNYSKAERSKLK